MLRKLLFPFLFVAFFAFQAFAQTGSITGTVTNEEGESVPTANVLLVEISRGAATNLEGEYTITDVEPGTYTLRVTFVGYADFTEQVTIQAGQTLTKNVTLQRGAVSLEELVVTGFGVESKIEYTGSASSVDVSQQIENVPVLNVGSALEGSVTGLTISAASGTPGAPLNIDIRGVSSINAGGDPLVVVDGIPVTTGAFDFTSSPGVAIGTGVGLLSSINPQTIADITVLKGPVATAQYGAQGANGVILITTKKGTAGETRYSFNYRRGTVGRAVEGPTSLSAFQMVELYKEGQANAGSPVTGDIPFWDGQTNTNWNDLVTNENAVAQQFQLSASGGTNQATFYGALGYQQQESIIINSGYERFSGTFNFGYDFNENIDINNQFKGSFAEQKGIRERAAFFANPVLARFFIPSTAPAFNEDGSFYTGPLIAVYNPLYIAENDLYRIRTYRVINSTKLNIDITDNLSFHSEAGLDFTLLEEKTYANPNYGFGANVNGFLRDVSTRVFRGTAQNGLEYIWDINDNHSIDARLIQTVQLFKFYRLRGVGQGFATEGLINLASASTPVLASSQVTDGSLLSVLGKVHYSYKDKIFLDGTIRREGNSRFAEGYRWGTFYGVGAGWLVSAEDFLSGSDVIDLLKIRASFGVSGNNNIGRNTYQSFLGYGAAYAQQGGSAPIQLGNVLLTWEKKRSTEIGLTFGLFNRLDGDVTVFHANTYDLLYQVPLSRTTGFANQFSNVGELVKKGIEVSLDVDFIRTEDFLVNVSGDFTYVTDEITELATDGTGNPITNITTLKYNAVEGYAVGTWYMKTWAGVNPDNGMPLWEVNDGDDTPGEVTSNYAEASKESQGATGRPTHYGSVGLRINYKGFYAGASLYGSFGNKIYDVWGFFLQSDGVRTLPGFGQVATQLDRWQQPGDITDVPQRIAGGNTGTGTVPSNAPSSRYLYDGDFLRLQTVRIGYNVPVSLLNNLKIGVRGLNVFFTGRNLWTYTFDDEYLWDPAVPSNGNVVLFAQPQKAFTFGIDIQF